jgi:WD40 repeat protein
MARYQTALSVAATLLTLAAEAARGQPAAADLHGDPLPAGAVARLGTLRFRHDSNVVFAAFLPDGKRVVSVGADGVACAWEFPSGKQVGRLEVYPADERRKAAARFDAELAASWSGRSAALVSGATLSPNGKHLTVFCGDGFLRVWDWAGARQLGKVADVRGSGSGAAGPAHSPDGKTLLLTTRVLQFVDLPGGKEVGPGPGHADALASVWFAPDGKQIVTQDARTTRTWDAVTGKGLGAVAAQLPNTPGGLTLLSPDGRVGVAVDRFLTPAVLRAGRGGEAVLFSPASGKELARITFEPGVGAVRFGGRTPLAFSPDGKLLAAASDAQQKVYLYEVPSGTLVRTLDVGAAAPPPPPNKGINPRGFPIARLRSGLQSMLFSPDGKALAFQAGPGAGVVVLDTTTGKQVASLPPLEGGTALQGAFTPDGRCLVVAQMDGTVTLYELASRQPRRTYGNKLPLSAADKARAELVEAMLARGGPFGAAALTTVPRVRVTVSPDGKLLALAGPAGSVHVWDVLAGKELTVFRGHAGGVNALAFAPDGKTLASAGDDTTALVWDATRIARPARPAKALPPGDLEARWRALAGSDAAGAFAAAGDFVAAPHDAVAWIKDRLRPAAPLDTQRVLELMKRLGDDRFRVRDQATRELLAMGEQSLSVLDKALAGELPAESRRRLEAMRGTLTSTALQGERLRAVRAVEVLEFIGTPQARQVLRELASGAPEALLTSSARAALKR